MAIYLRIETKKKVTTQLGELEVKKGHVLCPITGFRQSPYLQETALFLGQCEVYAEASEVLNRLCQVDLSAKQIEHICHHYGEKLEEQIIDNEYVTNEKSEKLHYAMLDGSYIMSRDGWVETKLGRVFQEDQMLQISPKRKQIKTSDYVAHIGNCGDFCQKFSKSLDNLSNIVFIADGALWIWNWVSTNYPDAVQILDFFHSYEKICQWGAMKFKDKEELSVWCKTMQELLLDDQVKEVILQLKELDSQGDILKCRDELIHYLENNQQRMMYKTFTNKGYLIGSGAIESAHRNVIQIRMKRSGQRWTIKGGQQILNIRTAKLSNKWEKVTNLVRMAA